MRLYLNLVSVGAFVLLFSLWLRTGSVIHSHERDLCWARASCDKLV